jgi:hypothetical protein
MTATQFGLGLLYIAVALIWYAAGWWQGKTVERDRWEERAAGQDQLVQRDQQGLGPEVRRQPFERISYSDLVRLLAWASAWRMSASRPGWYEVGTRTTSDRWYGATEPFRAVPRVTGVKYHLTDAERPYYLTGSPASGQGGYGARRGG